MRSIAIVLTCWVGALGMTAATALGSVQSLDLWLERSAHRLPNVRDIAMGCRAPIIYRFASMHDWGQPTLLLLGDSQVFADRINDEETWGYLLAREMGLNPINLSVIDGRPQDTTYIVQILEDHGYHAEQVVVNMNLSHFSRSALDSPRRIETGWANDLGFWACAYQARRFALDSTPRIPSDGDPRDTYGTVPLSPNYYAVEQEAARSILPAVLDAAAGIAEQSLAYVTPANLYRFSDYSGPNTSFVEADVRARSALFHAICEASPVSVCLNEIDAMPDDAFQDIVHRDVLGNRLLADELWAKRGAARDPRSTHTPPPT